jgi:hypothetical protein
MREAQRGRESVKLLHLICEDSGRLFVGGDRLKKQDEGREAKTRQAARAVEKLTVGQQLFDTHGQQNGVVLDIARQYAHPKAAPIFSYLVKWDDGQVLAITDAALDSQRRYEIVD